MKKTYNFLMSVAVAAMAFIGCTNTEISIDNNPAPAPVDGVYRQLTFAADTESDASRTHHTGETVHWSKGDRIRIGYTKGNVWQNAEGRTAGSGTAKLYASTEQDSDAELSVFRVTQLFKDTAATGELWFYGLYPSEITKRNEPDFSDSETGEINVYIPWIQSPTATSFDPKADLLVSKSRHSYESFPSYDEHIKMVWTRLVAHGQITLKNLLGEDMMVEGEKISFVEFTVDDGVNLTGDFTLTLNTADPDQPHMPTITSKSGSKNKVRLSFAENTEYNTLDGEGNFVVWFATAPFTTTSLSIKVGTDKAIYTRNIANANVTFKVNTRSTLGINMASQDTTREPLPAWELLTDINDLTVGKFVVIAAADYDVAMSTTQNNNNRAETAITKSGTSITIGSDVQVLKVEAGTVDGTWAFKDENASGYLYAASSSSNHLKTQTDLNANGSWTIEVTEDGIATVKAQGDKTRNWMRYNDTTNTGHLFSCYESGQKDISIYYISELPTTLGTPVLSDPREVEAKSVLVEWSETEGAIYYTVICRNTQNSVVKVFKNITDTSFVADNLSDGTWNITVTAHDGRYGATTSEPKTVTVTGIDPSVAIDPVSHTFNWKGGEAEFNITLNNLGDNVEITAESNNDAFKVSVEGTTVTVTADANATGTEISGTITIKATGSTIVSNSISVSQEAKPEGERTYTKIDKYLADFSGQYLIVYEGDDTHTSVAFDGSLPELDAPKNNKSVTITDGTITLSAAEDLFYFTIEKVDGDYSIKSASEKYIGRDVSSNGLNAAATTVYTNTISYSNGAINITGAGGASLQYNYAKDQLRFRYYENSGQKPIQLYRLEGTGNDETLTQLATPEVTATAEGNTISVSWTIVPNADSYTVTYGETKQTVNTNNATFEGLSYNTEYVISVVANPAANSTEYYASEPGTASVTTGEDPNEGGNTGGDDTGSTEQWARVTSLNDITAGTYAIICGDFILLNNSGSSRQAVTTYASKGITITNNTIASVPTECQWAFAGNNTAMTLSPVDDATKYLYSTKSGDGLRISTTHDTWSFSTGATANCFYIKDANKSVHLAVYNNQDWRSYTSATQAQSNMQLYKKTGGNSGGDTPVEPETPATPVLSINPETLSFDAAGGNKTVACTIENEVTGVNVTATESVDWLTTSVSGKTVTITATENTATTTRTATVTIAYTGADSKTVTVNQAAAEVTEKKWVRVTSTDMILSGGTFIIGYEATANSGVLVPMRSDMSGAKTSANGYHYSGTAIGTTTSNSTTINMSTISDTSAYEFTISASTTVSGAINIQRPDGNYIGNNNSKNTARLYTSVSANTAYGVTIAANDVVTLSCAAADTYKLLQYNSGSPRFANYTSGQKNLVIYKLQ